MVCYHSGRRSRFFFKLHIWRGRRDEPKVFSWRRYRDLIVMTHLADFAAPHLVDGCLPPRQ